MRHDWILDVLQDLCTYTSANGMADLAEHLADAKLIAAMEIATKKHEVDVTVHGQGGSGSDTAGFGRHQHA